MATLFTRIINDTGSGVSGAVLSLRRRWSPQARVGAVTSGEDILLTADANGFVSSPIVGGVFRVWIGGMRDPKLITVPDDDGTYLLEDLFGITGGTAALTYRYLAGVLELLNGTTGAFHPISIATVDGLTLVASTSGDTPANFRWESGCLQVLHVEDETWHPVWIVGATPQIAIGTAGETVSPNARISGGKLQLRNLTTNQYHTIYLTGAALTWAIAAGEA